MYKKQSKVINSYYCVKYLVSTKKAVGRGYETSVFRVIDHPYKARYEVLWDAPVFEAYNRTWLGAMITHYKKKNFYKEIADTF